MKHAITVLDMRGFMDMSEVLGKHMERVGLTTERVRGGLIHIVNSTIESCRESVPVTRSIHLGGDSWFIESATAATSKRNNRATSLYLMHVS
jgi:hypothetical protein